MEPRFESAPPRLLIGKKLQMSLAENRTRELWQSFMPVMNQIGAPISEYLFSVQVYSPGSDTFSLSTVFDKWAAIEVADLSSVPDGMETLTIPGGEYVVFIHKGAGPTAAGTFGYIFGTWLPTSGYVLDDRPHFEMLGIKYRNDHPESEEEIWLPVRLKS
ncbi:MAG: AraC family transcriptional regulator [Sphingobacteriales bacterium]|nr:MAG: AraC family transcriptional regulator [Sphingobacteriales bacterium]